MFVFVEEAESKALIVVYGCHGVTVMTYYKYIVERHNSSERFVTTPKMEIQLETNDLEKKEL